MFMSRILLLGLAGCLAFSGSAGAAGPRSGKAIYEAKCTVCHQTGVAGAPKLGDKEAWKPHQAHGLDHMVESVRKGKGAMPPMGTCADCSSEELKAAVQYMLDHSK
jgi:cytochrome c5